MFTYTGFIAPKTGLSKSAFTLHKAIETQKEVSDNRFEEIMANFNRMKEENPNFGLLERLLKEAEEKEEETTINN